jgi:hypothetical protein
VRGYIGTLLDDRVVLHVDEAGKIRPESVPWNGIERVAIESE